MSVNENSKNKISNHTRADDNCKLNRKSVPMNLIKELENKKLESSDIFSIMGVKLRRKQLIILNIEQKYENNKLELLIPIKSVSDLKLKKIEKEVSGIIFTNIYDLNGKIKRKLKMNKEQFKLAFFKENYDRMNFESDFFEYSGKLVFCKITQNITEEFKVSNKQREINIIDSYEAPKYRNCVTEIDIFESIKEKSMKEKETRKSFLGNRSEESSNYGRVFLNEYLKTELDYIRSRESVILNSHSHLNKRMKIDLSEELLKYGREGINNYRMNREGWKNINLNLNFRNYDGIPTTSMSNNEIEFIRATIPTNPQVKTEESSCSTEPLVGRRLITRFSNASYTTLEEERIKVLDTQFPHELPHIDIIKALKDRKAEERVRRLQKEMYRKLDIKDSLIIPMSLSKEESQKQFYIDNLDEDETLSDEVNDKLPTIIENETVENMEEQMKIDQIVIINEILKLIRDICTQLKEYKSLVEDLVSLEQPIKETSLNSTDEVELKLEFLIFVYISNHSNVKLDENVSKYFYSLKDKLTLLLEDLANVIFYFEEIKTSFYKSEISQLIFKSLILNQNKASLNKIHLLSLIFTSNESKGVDFENFALLRAMQKKLPLNFKSKLNMIKTLIRTVLQNKNLLLTEIIKSLSINEKQINQLLFLDADKENKTSEEVKKLINTIFNKIQSEINE